MTSFFWSTLKVSVKTHSRPQFLKTFYTKLLQENGYYNIFKLNFTKGLTEIQS